MKTTSTFAMLTLAAMMGATSAMAQTTPPATPTEVNLDALAALFAGNVRPTEAEIRAALASANLTVQRLRIEQDDDDNEVRVRAVTPEGKTIRIRVEDGDIRYRIGLFGDTSDVNGDLTSDTSDTSDDNGDDTSDTSDDNGGDTSDTSDSNGGDTSDTSDSNSGSSSDTSDSNGGDSD